MIRVGCCGWPVARDRYTREFDLVEVQQSFYRLPRLATVERWRGEVPADFEFVLKAPQLITHDPASPTYRKLGRTLTEAQRRRYGFFRPTPEVAAAWRATLGLARALRSRLVLFQCPASFTPAAEHVRDLTRFFETIERDGLRLAWEPRGDWPDAHVRALCRRLDLIHAVDPFQRASVWGEPAYHRLHGRGGARYRYTDEDLGELARRVGRGPAYVLFNNTAMWDDARRFRRLMGGTAVGWASARDSDRLAAGGRGADRVESRHPTAGTQPRAKGVSRPRERGFPLTLDTDKYRQ